MEGFAAFILALGMMAAAQDAQYRAAQAYHAHPIAYARAGYSPAVVYAPVPSPLPVMGALAGGLVGAGGGAPAVVIGATAGGLIGHAMSMPQVAYVAWADIPPAPRRSSASTEQFIDRWQSFMEPAARR
jgi:hypothetical protein